MNKKFANPYIIYYPVVSQDGMPFPVNRTVQDIQEEVNKGCQLCQELLWCGNIVAAKFTNNRFTQMMDASIADFPILKNFLGTHVSPGSASASSSTVPVSQHNTSPRRRRHTPRTSLTSLPIAPPASPHHPGDLAGLPSTIAQHMQLTEHAGTIPQAYDRDASVRAHGMPTGMGMMPPPRCKSKKYRCQTLLPTSAAAAAVANGAVISSSPPIPRTSQSARMHCVGDGEEQNSSLSLDPPSHYRVIHDDL